MTISAFLELCCGSTLCAPFNGLLSLIELCHFYQAEHAMQATEEAQVGSNSILQLYAYADLYSLQSKAKVLEWIRAEPHHVFGLCRSNAVASLDCLSKE